MKNLNHPFLKSNITPIKLTQTIPTHHERDRVRASALVANIYANLLSTSIRPAA